MTKLEKGLLLGADTPTLLHQVVEVEPNLEQKVFFVLSNASDTLVNSEIKYSIYSGVSLNNVVGYTHPVLASLIQFLFTDLQWPNIWVVEGNPIRQSIEGRVILEKAKFIRSTSFPLCPKVKFKIAAGLVGRIHKDKHYAEWVVDQYGNSKFSKYTSVELHDIALKISNRHFTSDPLLSLEMYGVLNVSRARTLLEGTNGTSFIGAIAKSVLASIYVAHIRGEKLNTLKMLEMAK